MPDDEHVPIDPADVEGDDDADHGTPSDLLELHEVIEWESAQQPAPPAPGDTPT